jgi:cytidine diphosphoramidate kinase
MVVWLVGLSGAGKSTLAQAVVDKARSTSAQVVLVDGDVIREVFGGDLGHSADDRRANAQRIARLCSFLDGEGVDVVCAILSIAEQDRSWMRAHASEYFEVFVDCDMENLVRRDSKGLYSAALSGDLPDVVGVDIEFERPVRPDLVIQNGSDVNDLLSHTSFLSGLITG